VAIVPKGFSEILRKRHSKSIMESEEFKSLRTRLGKTQKQIAQLLGTSLKAIHSYEQGWRTVPGHVERQMFFLVASLRRNYLSRKNCWSIKKCPPKQKKKCPAWEFKAGKLCWFINGTICDGKARGNWNEKMKICRSCEVFASLL
jgi:DNA-binding XRE family transcriptional regulator